MTEDEFRAISRAAGDQGPGVTLARFAAEATLAAAGAAKPARRVGGAPTRLALAEFAHAVNELSRVGNNLNQLAREKNATGARPIGTGAEVERVLAAVERLVEVADGFAE